MCERNRWTCSAVDSVECVKKKDGSVQQNERKRWTAVQQKWTKKMDLFSKNEEKDGPVQQINEKDGHVQQK